MKEMPEEILQVIGEVQGEELQIGMSDARVWMFPDHVLKVRRVDAESQWELGVMEALKGRLPVPEAVVSLRRDGRQYTLMTRVRGEMLCGEAYLSRPEQLCTLAAEAVKLLWSIPADPLLDGYSRLECRLETAGRAVEEGRARIDAEAEILRGAGFKTPEELLFWLQKKRPEEDLVLTHGDLCLPNILINNDAIGGFIDVGRMGQADRWQDLALLLRSLGENLSGKYSGGRAFGEFEPGMLLDRFGIPMDEEKYRYYLLLDELYWVKE